MVEEIKRYRFEYHFLVNLKSNINENSRLIHDQTAMLFGTIQSNICKYNHCPLNKTRNIIIFLCVIPFITLFHTFLYFLTAEYVDSLYIPSLLYAMLILQSIYKHRIKRLIRVFFVWRHLYLLFLKMHPSWLVPYTYLKMHPL